MVQWIRVHDKHATVARADLETHHDLGAHADDMAEEVFRQRQQALRNLIHVVVQPILQHASTVLLEVSAAYGRLLVRQ